MEPDAQIAFPQRRPCPGAPPIPAIPGGGRAWALGGDHVDWGHAPAPEVVSIAPSLTAAAGGPRSRECREGVAAMEGRGEAGDDHTGPPEPRLPCVHGRGLGPVGLLPRRLCSVTVPG